MSILGAQPRGNEDPLHQEWEGDGRTYHQNCSRFGPKSKLEIGVTNLEHVPFRDGLAVKMVRDTGGRNLLDLGQRRPTLLLSRAP